MVRVNQMTGVKMHIMPSMNNMYTQGHRDISRVDGRIQDAMKQIRTVGRWQGHTSTQMKRDLRAFTKMRKELLALDRQLFKHAKAGELDKMHADMEQMEKIARQAQQRGIRFKKTETRPTHFAPAETETLQRVEGCVATQAAWFEATIAQARATRIELRQNGHATKELDRKIAAAERQYKKLQVLANPNRRAHIEEVQDFTSIMKAREGLSRVLDRKLEVCEADRQQVTQQREYINRHLGAYYRDLESGFTTIQGHRFGVQRTEQWLQSSISTNQRMRKSLMTDLKLARKAGDKKRIRTAQQGVRLCDRAIRQAKTELQTLKADHRVIDAAERRVQQESQWCRAVAKKANGNVQDVARAYKMVRETMPKHQKTMRREHRQVLATSTRKSSMEVARRASVVGQYVREIAALAESLGRPVKNINNLIDMMQVAPPSARTRGARTLLPLRIGGKRVMSMTAPIRQARLATKNMTQTPGLTAGQAQQAVRATRTLSKHPSLARLERGFVAGMARQLATEQQRLRAQ